MNPRAAPLTADARRAAILEAVVPLVLTKGPRVTTRELAEAAGVAEGTLFRVFDSKDGLVFAAARSVFSRADHLIELGGIDPNLPLRDRLVAVARVWQRVVGRMLGVFVAFNGVADRERLGDPRSLADHSVVARAERIVEDLLAPDADRLRVPVAEVIRMLGGLAMMSVHPADVGYPMSAEEVVDLLLYGVAQPDPPHPGRCPAPDNRLTLT